MRATILTLAILLALGAPAGAADMCDDLARATQGGIKDHWPEARFAVYAGPDSEAIQNGLRRIGARVADAERKFLVITRPSWTFVRVVGFVDGCYEDFLDISRDQLDLWLAGQPASD